MVIKTQFELRKWVCLLLAGCIAFVLIVFSKGRAIGDFGNYYFASKFLAQGQFGLWIYDPYQFNIAIYRTGLRDFFLNYTPVTPFTALLYVPLTFFEPFTAKIIWNLFSAAVLLVGIYKLITHYGWRNEWIFISPLLILLPLRNNFIEGQTYGLIFFLLASGFIAYRKQQLWLMAICWAVAILLKITPAFVLFFLLFQKDYRALFKLSLALLLFFAFSVPFVSFMVWREYLIDILPRLAAGDINNTYALNYQSMQVLLKKMFVPDAFDNLGAWFNNSYLYVKLLLTFKVVIFGLSVLASFTSASAEKKFAVWLLSSFLLSGYGNSFSLMLLLLLFADNELRNFSGKGIWVTVLILAAANLPFNLLSTLPLPLQFHRLYLLLFLFLLVLRWIHLQVKLYYAVWLVIPWCIPAAEVVTGRRYLQTDKRIVMIKEFDVSGDSVLFQHFNFYGPQKQTVALPFHVNKLEWKIPQREVFINDSVSLCLSDEGRGVGFYTLMYVQLQ